MMMLNQSNPVFLSMTSASDNTSGLIDSFLSGDIDDKGLLPLPEDGRSELLDADGGAEDDWKNIKARLQLSLRFRANIHPLDNSNVPALLSQWTQAFKHSKYLLARQKQQQQYAEWRSLLRNGFNLAFYGAGSMKDSLEAFCFEELSPRIPVVILNGYYPQMNPKDLISIIATKVIQDYYAAEELPASLESKIAFCARFFASRGKSMILMIHSIDEMIRLNHAMWEFICDRLVLPTQNVRLVVSVDHHLAPTALSPALAFLWFPIPTGLPYDKELTFRDHSNAVTNNTSPMAATLSEERVRTLVASLPPRALLLFCFFANLVSKESGNITPIHFDLLLDKIRQVEAMDYKTLEAHLNHFQANGLITRDTKTQMIRTNIQYDVLQRVLDHHMDVWIIYASELL